MCVYIRRFIRILLLCAPLVSSQVCDAQNALTNGLVAHYPFDRNALDASGNGRQLTVVDAVLTVDRFGNADQAFHFNGTSAHLVGNAEGLPVSARTISVWMKSEAGADSGALVLSYGGDQTSASYLMGVDSTCMGPIPHYAVWPHGNSHTALAPRRAGQAEWAHWVVTIQAGVVTSYINGAAIAISEVAFPNTVVEGKVLAIGGLVLPSGEGVYSDDCGTYFKGIIDDVRLYDRALPPSEVRLLNQVEASPLNSMTITVKSVQVDVVVTAGQCYQLQTSVGLGEWVPVGGVRFATTQLLSERIEVNAAQQFFRVFSVPCP
jgi:hypothetical protein